MGRPKGSRHSEETKAKMRVAHLGRPKSVEHAANIAKARIGMKHTSESKEKNRLAHLGKKHTEQGLANVRAANKRRSGPGHQWWGKTPMHGPRTHWHWHNGVALRSKYEVRFAKAMDARRIAWEYEPCRFDLGTCTYLPDFYIPSTGAFWEIKGWLDPKSAKKIRLFRERYPEYPLIVATNDVLTLMERQHAA